MTSGCCARKLVAARRNLKNAWDRMLREHTDPVLGETHIFQVWFADGETIYHFGGLETLTQSLIDEHGGVVRAVVRAEPIPERYGHD